MAYRAPRLRHASEQDFAHYPHVMNGLYEFHDAMLGRMLALAGPDTTVLLMSDHGFQSGKRAVALDPDNPLAFSGLAQVALEQADFAQAAQHALPGIDVDYREAMVDPHGTAARLAGLVPQFNAQAAAAAIVAKPG